MASLVIQKLLKTIITTGHAQYKPQYKVLQCYSSYGLFITATPSTDSVTLPSNASSGSEGRDGRRLVPPLKTTGGRTVVSFFETKPVDLALRCTMPSLGGILEEVWSMGVVSVLSDWVACKTRPLNNHCKLSTSHTHTHTHTHQPWYSHVVHLPMMLSLRV